MLSLPFSPSYIKKIDLLDQVQYFHVFFFFFFAILTKSWQFCNFFRHIDCAYLLSMVKYNLLTYLTTWNIDNLYNIAFIIYNYAVAIREISFIYFLTKIFVLRSSEIYIFGIEISIWLTDKETCISNIMNYERNWYRASEEFSKPIKRLWNTLGKSVFNEIKYVKQLPT